jgi:hypothetical protein
MRKLLLSTILLYSPTAFAHGDEHYKPAIKGFGAYGDINLIDNFGYDADRRSNEFNEISTHTHATVYYNFNEATSINSMVELAHQHSHSHGTNDPADNKLFEQQGITIKELYLEHKSGKANFYAGKITPVVTFHYDDYPLVWAHEPAEEYATQQKLGFGFGYQLTARQSVNLSTFFADTTVLSDSALASVSNNIDEDDGSAGNTEAFNNFAFNYKIKLPELNNTLLSFGYAFQKQGNISESDENLTTVGLKKYIELGEDLDLDIIAEYVNELNSGGRTGRRITYYNFGSRLNYGKAFLATNITDKDSNEEHPRAKFYNFAAGYEILPDIEASLGWKAEDEKGNRTESAVAMLSYKFDICPCE